MKDQKAVKVVRGALTAAIYALLTVIFAPLSYGPVQVRVAEALTVLPFLWPETALGLFAGCIVANFFGGLGLWDIGLGSVATLLAGWCTAKVRTAWLAPLPPVLINGIVVGSYLSVLFRIPWWASMIYVAAGEVVVCYFLGLPLLKMLQTIRR